MSEILQGAEPEKSEPLTTHNKAVLLDDHIEEYRQHSSTYDFLETAYKAYSDAMRRRDREPLEFESFENHFFHNGNFETSLVFGNETDGYLFGSEFGDVFVPTHFAPYGLKGGYRLMQALQQSETPTALLITQDLVDTLKKMPGWKILPFRLKKEFRGELVDKIIVFNSWKAAGKLVMYQVREELRGLGERLDDRLYKAREWCLNLAVAMPNTNWDKYRNRKTGHFASDYDEFDDDADNDGDERYLGLDTLRKLREMHARLDDLLDKE